jgi:hypothetical protein
MALTRFTLGFQVRLERLWEWLTLMPKAISLSQNWHFAMVEAPPCLCWADEQLLYIIRTACKLQEKI